MAKVHGYDRKKIEKHVTCDQCAAIVSYLPLEVKQARYTCMGDPSGHDYVACPACRNEIRIPGTSW